MILEDVRSKYYFDGIKDYQKHLREVERPDYPLFWVIWGIIVLFITLVVNI